MTDSIPIHHVAAFYVAAVAIGTALGIAIERYRRARRIRNQSPLVPRKRWQAQSLFRG